MPSFQEGEPQIPLPRELQLAIEGAKLIKKGCGLVLSTVLIGTCSCAGVLAAIKGLDYINNFFGDSDKNNPKPITAPDVRKDTERGPEIVIVTATPPHPSEAEGTPIPKITETPLPNQETANESAIIGSVLKTVVSEINRAAGCEDEQNCDWPPLCNFAIKIQGETGETETFEGEEAVKRLFEKKTQGVNNPAIEDLKNMFLAFSRINGESEKADFSSFDEAFKAGENLSAKLNALKEKNPSLKSEIETLEGEIINCFDKLTKSIEPFMTKVGGPGPDVQAAEGEAQVPPNHQEIPTPEPIPTATATSTSTSTPESTRDWVATAMAEQTRIWQESVEAAEKAEKTATAQAVEATVQAIQTEATQVVKGWTATAQAEKTATASFPTATETSTPIATPILTETPPIEETTPATTPQQPPKLTEEPEKTWFGKDIIWPPWWWTVIKGN